MFFYVFFVTLVYFLLPTEAMAWGPGAHMTYALHGLAHLAVFSPAIRALLKKHGDSFLYGSIAADIILGKKYAGELYHCHNWEVAFSLLNRAQEDRERAFIYGYLGHLSVDTVAHNFYVPYKVIQSYQTLTLRHTYWEMRYDLKMDPNVWKVLERIAKEDYLDLDRFLEKSLKRSLFSFTTNKKIFNSLLIVQRMKKWREAALLLAKNSSYSLEDREVREFKGLCEEVLVEFFTDPNQARVLHADPSGKLKLLYAKEMVKDLRSYTLRGIISPRQAQDLIESVRVHLRQGIYKPTTLPVITDALQ